MARVRAGSRINSLDSAFPTITRLTTNPRTQAHVVQHGGNINGAVILAFFLIFQIQDLALGHETPNCHTQLCDHELQQARTYLLETARPGSTMVRQGPAVAIERLHPEFAKRLANAIRDARSNGLSEAGIFSAYRPPVFGVGGFGDKYYSLHAYRLAVDMLGIGRAGSPEAQKWHEIAATHGIVCPYGYQNRVEWNYCQSTHLENVKSENPLRTTITASGPIELKTMFDVGRNFIASVESTIKAVVANRMSPNPRTIAFRQVRLRTVQTKQTKQRLASLQSSRSKSKRHGRLKIAKWRGNAGG